MIFKDIPGFDGYYAISESGVIKSLDRIISGRNGFPKPIKGKELKWNRDKYGYPYVNLYLKGRGYRSFIHRLVALTYIPNPNNYPYVLHNDDDSTNPHVTNLHWGTQLHNMSQMMERGRHYKGVDSYNALLNDDIVRKIRKMYASGKYTQRKIAKECGTNYKRVHKVVHGKIWKHVK